MGMSDEKKDENVRDDDHHSEVLGDVPADFHSEVSDDRPHGV